MTVRTLTPGSEVQLDPREVVRVRVAAPAAPPSAESPVLDASALVLDRRGRVLLDEDSFVFYGRPGTGSPVSWRQVRPGEEVIDVRLPALPPSADGVLVVATVYEAQAHGQRLSDVHEGVVTVSCPVRTPVAVFDLPRDVTGAFHDGRVVAAVFRRADRWVLRVSDELVSDGLRGLATRAGVPGL